MLVLLFCMIVLRPNAFHALKHFQSLQLESSCRLHYRAQPQGLPLSPGRL